jgi:hypothetical protein
MPNTFTIISSNTLSTSAASITFSAIPNTYTDLVVKYSARGTSGGWNYVNLTINGNTSSIYSITQMNGSGTSFTSSRQSNQASMQLDTNTIPSQDSSLFSNAEYYIPSYLHAFAKPLNAIAVGERNNAEAYINGAAGLADSTSAITSITLQNLTSNFVANSSFYLYGISKS